MDPATDIPDMTEILGGEFDCQNRLAPVLEAAEMLDAGPLLTSEVVQLLRKGGGFDVNVELLENWARSSMVPNVRIVAGQFSWSHQNILVALVQADTWRRWIPLDPRHIAKQSGIEIAEAMARLEGTTTFTDMETFDVNAFVQVLSDVEDAKTRHAFGVALKTKLRNLGVLDK